MDVKTTHHVDERATEDGKPSYRYEYDLYRFSDGKVAIVARSYTDDQREAHFLRIEQDGELRGLVNADIESVLFRAAVEHLEKIGKTELTWLSEQAGGYIPALAEWSGGDKRRPG